MTWDDLLPALAKLGVALEPACVGQLRALRDLVLARNESLNLTRITEEHDFVEKHVLDSLAGLSAVPEDQDASTGPRVVDVGSGAGFPGLAIAIARPRARVALVESTRKKAAFLEEAARTLGLANVSVLAVRAEEAAREASLRDSFDRATVRAVGSVPLALEYALPFVRKGGVAILYCGPENESLDLEAAARVAPFLGGGEPRTVSYDLPRSGGRRLLVVPKMTPTPDRFPRRAGAAAKRPLG